MFKLIAALFMVANGQVSDEPVARLVNRTHFQTEEACMNYFDTPDGVLQKHAIEEGAKSQSLTVKFSCEKEAEKDTI